MKNKVYYHFWWDGYLKKDATWESKDDLKKDGLKVIIDDYEKSKV